MVSWRRRPTRATPRLPAAASAMKVRRRQHGAAPAPSSHVRLSTIAGFYRYAGSSVIIS